MSDCRLPGCKEHYPDDPPADFGIDPIMQAHVRAEIDRIKALPEPDRELFAAVELAAIALETDGHMPMCAYRLRKAVRRYRAAKGYAL